MDQKPYLQPQVAPASLRHPQSEVLALVPEHMRPLLGVVISGIDLDRQGGIRLNMALKAAGVDVHSDMSSALDEGMAGLKLTLQYLLSKKPFLSDLAQFSEAEYEQRELEDELFLKYGSAPVASIVGTGDYIAEQLQKLILAHSWLANKIRYHPELVGDARPTEWRAYEYKDLVSRVSPFPELGSKDLEQVEVGLARAHMFFSDDTYEVSLEEAKAEILHGRDLPEANEDLETIIAQLEDREVVIPWLFLAGQLVRNKVNLDSIESRFLSEEEPNRLFRRLAGHGVIKTGSLRSDSQVDPEQLYAPCRDWKLTLDDASYLARLVNGQSVEDESRTRSMLLSIATDLLEERKRKRKGAGFSCFSEEDFEPPTLYNEELSERDIKIFNLKQEGESHPYAAVIPIFREMLASAGIDIRSVEEQLEELDPIVLSRLKRWGAWDEGLLNGFNIVSLEELGVLEAAPWSLERGDIEVIFRWINGLSCDDQALQDVLVNLYSRYEEIMGFPAIVVVDVHRERNMDGESLNFWQRVASSQKASSQPMLYTAVPFPGEEAEVGLDVLKTKLMECFARKVWGTEMFSETQKWARIVGRHPEYEESLRILKEVAVAVMYNSEDDILAEGYWLAQDRKEGGSITKMTPKLVVLTTLLPGFLEQGRRAAADANLEQAEFALQMAVNARDYLLATLSEDGIAGDDIMAQPFAVCNDDILLLEADYQIARFHRSEEEEENEEEENDEDDEEEDEKPDKAIYSALKMYLRLVGAHKMAVKEPPKSALQPANPTEVFQVEGQPIASVEVAQQGVLERLGDTWVGKLCPCLRQRKKKEVEKPMKRQLTAELRVTSTFTPEAQKQTRRGLTERAFLKSCSLLEERRRLHKISVVSPLAATPAVLYALAGRYYMRGDDVDYEAVIDIGRRVHYGYESQEYGTAYWNKVTQVGVRDFNPDIGGVDGYAPILKFGERYYLEILRLGVQASYQVLRKRAAGRYAALAEGRSEGPEFEAYEEADGDYRGMIRSFDLVYKKFPGEISPYRLYNHELVQGQVALEMDRDFDAAARHFRRAARLVVDKDGNALPGQGINARRSRHASVENGRQWVDCHFWEQEQGEPSEEMLSRALRILYQTCLVENSVVVEEKGLPPGEKSQQNLAEYQMTLLQGLASLVVLKDQHGKDAKWGRYPDVVKQFDQDEWEEIAAYDEDTELKLREISDELIESFPSLFELAPSTWVFIAGQIAGYLGLLSQKSPESALLPQLQHEWQGLQASLGQRLQDKPPLN
jgi:hypothetical protein